jgi:Ca2+-binding RTX toxin-like protein
MTRYRAVLAGAACVAGVLGGTTSASAGTVGAAGGAATFAGAGGEANVVTVSFDASAGQFEFYDAAYPLRADSGCGQVDANRVRCAASGVDRLVLLGGPGSDRMSNHTATRSRLIGGGEDDELNGGSGPDVADGQTGEDLVDGGDGDDRLIDPINANGADTPDRYTCGSGNDRVEADVSDIVAADCEQVTRPVPGPGGTLVPGAIAPDSGPKIGPCGPDLLGTANPDRLVGDNGRNRIYGLRGDDRIQGLGGADCLFGGDDHDRMTGEGGRDTLSGGGGDDMLSGGAGRDSLITGGGRNVAIGGRGNDRISSANGRRDVVRCGRGADRVTADRFDRVHGCEVVSRAR